MLTCHWMGLISDAHQLLNRSRTQRCDTLAATTVGRVRSGDWASHATVRFPITSNERHRGQLEFCFVSTQAAGFIKLAGRLHDIGKIGVPDRILLKPGAMADAEWKLMQGGPGPNDPF